MVTADPREAAAAIARGDAVVLIVGPGGPNPLPRARSLAVFVGDADDPATWDAARAMALELFPPGPPRSGR